jgi:hypothetical protein
MTSVGLLSCAISRPPVGRGYESNTCASTSKHFNFLTSTPFSKRKPFQPVTHSNDELAEDGVSVRLDRGRHIDLLREDGNLGKREFGGPLMMLSTFSSKKFNRDPRN